MDLKRVKAVISAILMFFAVLLIIQPVSATGTVTIAYSGSGGAFVCDNIFFNGIDTVGNNLTIKISGPGISSQGVPLYNLTGDAGSGNPVTVNPDGTWKILWSSPSTKGIENMQTARYYFTVFDASSPDVTATTSILIKKPAFYITAAPNPAVIQDYVVLTGNAERVTTNVKIDITDNSGTVYHTFFAPVGADGYFNYGFHVDMQPGQYIIVVSSPSMNNTLRTVFTVAAPQSPVLIATQPVAVTTPDMTPVTTAATTAAPASPTQAPLSPFTTIAGILVIGGRAISWQTSRRKE